jgi:hypothetical protein
MTSLLLFDDCEDESEEVKYFFLDFFNFLSLFIFLCFFDYFLLLFFRLRRFFLTFVI